MAPEGVLPQTAMSCPVRATTRLQFLVWEFLFACGWLVCFLSCSDLGELLFSLKLLSNKAEECTFISLALRCSLADECPPVSAVQTATRKTSFPTRALPASELFTCLKTVDPKPLSPSNPTSAWRQQRKTRFPAQCVCLHAGTSRSRFCYSGADCSYLLGHGYLSLVLFFL